ncbi:hypothetical protein H5410_036186 [Solanum commersonii]|uniref:Cytochrome P450 n=1 Tax=Solanum commersonii TaxID=4109 RepID=A0A9J5Y4N9_SOLCO|nr:hypothetical protein H5410_036186 [Solanum commersonii]
MISKTAFGNNCLEGKNIFQMLMKLTFLVSKNAHKTRSPVIREEEKISEEHNFGSDFLGKLLDVQELLFCWPGDNIFFAQMDNLLTSYKQGKVPNANGLSRLKIMNMILDESLRLYPPIPFIKRKFELGVVKDTNNNLVAFFLFVYGPRTYLGLNFAMIEAKISLSMILQRYMFTISPTYAHSHVQLYMLRPQHGVKIILHKSSYIYIYIKA